MRKLDDVLLYAITDGRKEEESQFKARIQEALEGQLSILQFRDKSLDDTQFLARAKWCQEICKAYQVPFIVNDRVEIAKQINADGVHIGQEDLEALKARAYLGEECIIGVSARTVEDAILAEKNGADYLGVGAVFSTNTKKDAKSVSLEVLKEIVRAVSIPVVAIGGITKDNMNVLKDSGISGVAVVSDLFGKKDIKKAALLLREESKSLFGGDKR